MPLTRRDMLKVLAGGAAVVLAPPVRRIWQVPVQLERPGPVFDSSTVYIAGVPFDGHSPFTPEDAEAAINDDWTARFGPDRTWPVDHYMPIRFSPIVILLSARAIAR